MQARNGLKIVAASRNPVTRSAKLHVALLLLRSIARQWMHLRKWSLNMRMREYILDAIVLAAIFAVALAVASLG